MDGLVLLVEMHGGVLVECKGDLYVNTTGAADAKLTVHFPPQHVAERARLSEQLGGCGAAQIPVDLPLASCLSRASRLVFSLPPDQLFRLDEQTMLDWRRGEPVLVPVSIPDLGLTRPAGGGPVQRPGAPTPRPPRAGESEIWLPSGLVISPHEYMHWAHRDVPHVMPSFVRGKHVGSVAELWETHAELDPAFVEANPGREIEELKTIRGVWQRDSCADTLTPEGSLPNKTDRSQVVALSAGFHLPQRLDPSKPYRPRPMPCRDLRLSPLGGSVKAKGKWDPLSARHPRHPQKFDVTEYEQQTLQGRDQYVRVENLMVACPTGNLVILVRERTRRFLEATINGKRGVAAIIEAKYFTKHVPPGEYPALEEGLVKIGRRWPFQSVEFEWPEDVELRRPVDVLTRDWDTNDRPAACWMIPKCGTEPLDVQWSARDRQQQRCDFKAPVYLINLSVATGGDDAKLRRVLEIYRKDPRHAQVTGKWLGLRHEHYRTVQMAGQKVGFVPLSEAETENGDNRGSLVTRHLELAVETDPAAWSQSFFPPLGRLPAEYPAPGGFPAGWDLVKFYPAVSTMRLRLREAEAYSVSPETIGTGFTWNPLYAGVGFNEATPRRGGPRLARNKGEIFLDVIGAADLDFAGDRGGGLATPSLDIRFFSRKKGIVGGSAPVAPVAPAMAAPYAPSELASGGFKPTQFLSPDAKLIGDITLADVLHVIGDAVNEPGLVPEHLGETLADIKGALEQLQALVELVETVKSVVDAFPSSLDEAIDEVSNMAEQLLQEALRDVLGDVVGRATRGLVLDDDSAAGLSLVKTFAQLLDSVQTHYPGASNEAVLQLKAAFDPSRLIRAVKSALGAAAGEITKFTPFDIKAPLRRVDRIVESLRDPQSVLEGAFLDEAEALLDDLGLGANGIEQLARRAVTRFLKAVESALDRVVVAIDAEVQRMISDLAAALRTFPLAVDAATSPAARARMLAYEDYLQRTVADALGAARNGILRSFSGFLNGPALFNDDTRGLMGRASAALRPVGDTIRDVIRTVREALDQIPQSISIKYDWSTGLKTGPSGFPIFVATNLDETRDARLVLRSRFEKRLGLSREVLASKPTVQAELRLTDFKIVLIPTFEFVIVGFKELSIRSEGLKKPKVDTSLDGVEFGDSLAFVQQIAALFSSDSGFYVDVSSAGVRAGYRYAVPGIAVGAFSLSDLSLGVDFTLPFDRTPIQLGLRVSERKKPCLLSVGILGGTAFFGLRLAPREDSGAICVRMLEGALEFGAVVQASLGPAKGRLYVLGGVYYGRENNLVRFSGYVRAGGSLEVLSLISISAEFYVGLEYQKQGGNTQVFGEASITVRVKIMFVINTSVDVRYRKQFQGSPPPEESRSLAEGAAAAPPAADEDKHVPIRDSEWRSYSRQFG